MTNQQKYMDQELQRLKNYIKKYKRKRDYEGLFAITQVIISERKNSLKKKIENYIKKSKQHINDITPLSRKERQISFLNLQLDKLSKKYDMCSKLENELQNMTINELIKEVKNQYNEYLREGSSIR